MEKNKKYHVEYGFADGTFWVSLVDQSTKYIEDCVFKDLSDFYNRVAYLATSLELHDSYPYHMSINDQPGLHSLLPEDELWTIESLTELAHEVRHSIDEIKKAYRENRKKIYKASLCSKKDTQMT